MSTQPTTEQRVSSRTALRAALSQAWQQRTPRERQLMQIAAWVLIIFGLWSWAIAPALRTWHEAPTRQAALDATSGQMQQLQAQAQAFKKPQAVTRAEALRWLEDNIPTQLGAETRWQLQGERLSVQLSGSTPEQLASWLKQARERAQALPVQAQLQQASTESAGPAAGKVSGPTSTTKMSSPASQPDTTGQAVRWNGSLLLSLP
jgi:general secretion pathway protein M